MGDPNRMRVKQNGMVCRAKGSVQITRGQVTPLAVDRLGGAKIARTCSYKKFTWWFVEILVFLKRVFSAFSAPLREIDFGDPNHARAIGRSPVHGNDVVVGREIGLSKRKRARHLSPLCG